MPEELDPNLPWKVLLSAQRTFGNYRSPKTTITIYSKQGSELVILETPGQIEFVGKGRRGNIRSEETLQFIELRAEFGEVMLRIAGVCTERTFPSYEDFIKAINE